MTVFTTSISKDLGVESKWEPDPLEVLCPPMAESGIAFSCSVRDLQAKANRTITTKLKEGSWETAGNSLDVQFGK